MQGVLRGGALALAIAGGCQITGDGGTSFGSSQTGFENTSITQSGTSDDTAGSAGSMTTDGSTTGDSGTDSGMTGPGTSGGSATATNTTTVTATATASGGTTDSGGSTGMTSMTGGSGGTTTTGGGPACANPGDLVVQGATGPANANQNCPTTLFPIQVVGAAGPITDVELLFNASVATTSEFTLKLISPAQTSVTLFDKHGGPFSDDFVDTLFDDGATSPIATAPAPRTGCFTPDQPLTAFNGQAADGTWNIEVQTCLYAVTITQAELRLTF